MTTVAVVLTLLLLTGGSAAAQSQAGVLVFTRASVIDGIAPRPLHDASVVVRDGRIERISSTSVPVAAGARVIDLGGRWLLPGLVDAHVHLRDLASARAALQSGVTTARSMGVNHFADVGMRELHRAGVLDVPEVLAAGYHVRRRLADEFFLDAPELHALMPGIAGPEPVRQAVLAMARRGVDVIKVMATERAGTRDTDPLRRVLSDEELAAAVAEAGRAGIGVVAHAHTDEGAHAAVRAGVRSIEHGTLLSDTTLGLMKRRQVCLTPTTTFWLDMLEPGGEYDHPELAARARAMLPRLRTATKTAWEMGVQVAAGSDMRYDSPNGLRIADEIAALVQSGVSAMGAIQAATSTAAVCLGIAGRTGSIQPGLEADLIVVDGDPLSDIHLLRRPLLVVNNGRVVADQRGQ